jgi:hypothetical protein
MAIRLGFFTGKLYDGSVDTSTIKECCAVLNWKEPILEDEPLLIEKRKQLRMSCTGCFGCEESRKGYTFEPTIEFGKDGDLRITEISLVPNGQ